MRAQGESRAGPSRLVPGSHLVSRDWEALDALPGGSADDELAGVMPTMFERVDALGIYAFDADRRAGQLRPLRARVSFR
jgi:hypothetical protein